MSLFTAVGGNRALVEANAYLPEAVALPRPSARTVARYLADRREFPVLDVVEALATLAHPELLRFQTDAANVILTGGTSDVIATGASTAVLASPPCELRLHRTTNAARASNADRSEL